MIALLCGISTSISLYALNQPAVFGALGWEPLFKISEPFLYFSIWSFTVTAVVLFVLSLLSGPVPEEKLKYVFGGHGRAPATDDGSDAEGATT